MKSKFGIISNRPSDLSAKFFQCDGNLNYISISTTITKDKRQWITISSPILSVRMYIARFPEATGIVIITC